MNSNGILRKHWFHVALHFSGDVGLFVLGFLVAFLLRFGMESEMALWMNWPLIVFGAIVFASATYIAGLYSTHSASKGVLNRSLLLLVFTGLATLTLIGLTYGFFVRPLGRGVVVLGAFFAYISIVVHHISLLHALRTSRERVLYLVTSAFDEAETKLLSNFGGKNLELIGLITACGYKPTGSLPVLGSVTDIAEIVKREKIDRVLCTTHNLSNATLTRHFCKLRYSGVTVMPLINICEEIEQYVPLELVSHEWLLSASGEPHLFYIKKVKRLIDIVAAVVGLTLAAPLVGVAALLVRVTSRGPIFYRQMRCGRFGRVFQMTKLRTMYTDSEAAGAQWSSKNDPRVTPIGHFLRKYRVDEIPQLWHVLCGDMSFVGPRPERPEIIAQLARDIPFYEERLMVQPGITGWAQVSYPYGASVLDARRKLEYDLYYMKHMSVFLDAFIVLDTVRTVICGGAPETRQRPTAAPENIMEWERLKAAHHAGFNQPPPDASPRLELGAA